jgi:hypothetical protein
VAVTLTTTAAHYEVGNGLVGVRVPVKSPDLGQPLAPIQGRAGSGAPPRLQRPARPRVVLGFARAGLSLHGHDHAHCRTDASESRR